MLVMMCPKCVSWYHLQCLEQCMGDCDNSIAGWRFWNTGNNYYSCLGKRSPLCSTGEATSVTTITNSLLIINITIKIVINLDKNHHFFSGPAHWSDPVVANKLMLCHSFPLCAFLLTHIVFVNHAGSCHKQVLGNKIRRQERELQLLLKRGIAYFRRTLNSEVLVQEFSIKPLHSTKLGF